ncbi:hypothetical protein [Streptomyces sp. KR55]|uniref:hypothetical protein n=1 Tax=Streptomyces sp. KR55 TaxID=3457425 RepID=UPI003FD1D187
MLQGLLDPDSEFVVAGIIGGLGVLLAMDGFRKEVNGQAMLGVIVAALSISIIPGLWP